MVHISKSSKTNQFYVTVVGNNGEKLSVSEQLKTKQSAWKNIRAQLKVMQTDSTYVQDNTVKKPAVVRCFAHQRLMNPTAMLAEVSP